MSLAVVVRRIFFRSGKCKVVLDRLWALYPWLVLDDIEDFVDGKSEWSKVFFYLEGLEWIRRENRERLSFVGRLPLIRVTGMGESFVPRLRLLSVIATFERLVGGALHHLLKLDVRLGSEEDLTHPSYVIL